MGPGDPPGGNSEYKEVCGIPKGAAYLFLYSFPIHLQTKPGILLPRAPAARRAEYAAPADDARIFSLPTPLFFGRRWGRGGPPGRQRSGETGMKKIRMRRHLDFYNKIRSDGAGRAGPFCRKRMQFYTEESARAAGGRFPAAASQNCQFPPKTASKLCAS